jgi:beta-glucosidase-like glycosyl hydrolase
LGLGVEEDLSPSLMRKITHLGAKLGSFASAAETVAETLDVTLTPKRVERLTERIGGERVAERNLSIAEWEALPLMQKLAAPAGITAPAVVAVSCDGGRMQRLQIDGNAQAETHPTGRTFPATFPGEAVDQPARAAWGRGRDVGRLCRAAA